jgi:hypothetical protein
MTGPVAGGDRELTDTQNTYERLFRRHAGRREAAGAVPGKADRL